MFEQPQVETESAKRAASGLSPEQWSLQDAFMAGQRAGEYGHGSSLNPYQVGCAEHSEWERARIGVIGQRLQGVSARRLGGCTLRRVA